MTPLSLCAIMAALLIVVIVQQKRQGRHLKTLLVRRAAASPLNEDVNAAQTAPMIPVDMCPDDGTLHLPRTPEMQKYWDEYNDMLHLKELTKTWSLPTYFGVMLNPKYVVWPDKQMDGTGGRITNRRAWNDTLTLINVRDRWFPARRYSEASSIELKGDFVSFINMFPSNYAHFLYDHLPHIAHMRDVLPKHLKILLVDVGGSGRRILQLIDPDFEASRIEWITLGQVYKIQGNLLYNNVPGFLDHKRFPVLARKVRDWIHEKIPPYPTDNEKTVIYYSRSDAKNVYHGRVVDSQHQQEILDIIRQSMQKNNRPERLIVYNGYQDDGVTPMTVDSQLTLFRSSTAIIGPHGSGLANFIWMDPPLQVTDCHDRPKILEFLNYHESEVQDGGMGRTFYMQYSFPSWIEYHHILYTKNSTHERTFVNLEHLQLALDAMWKETRII